VIFRETLGVALRLGAGCLFCRDTSGLVWEMEESSGFKGDFGKF
jgi:hypothetical protein